MATLADPGRAIASLGKAKLSFERCGFQGGEPRWIRRRLANLVLGPRTLLRHCRRVCGNHWRGGRQPDVAGWEVSAADENELRRNSAARECQKEFWAYSNHRARSNFDAAT